MESDKSVKLSTSEKAEIFEYVNDMYLHLKGQKKKQTKQSFKTSWKEDNMCYILMMKLNDAYDQWSEHEQNEDWEFDKSVIKNSDNKSISMMKHRRHLAFVREEVFYLETELEKVKEGKGYISEEAHDIAMKQLKEEQQQIIRDQGDTIAKLRQSEAYAREKMEIAEKQREGLRLYYEDQIKSIVKEQE
jgi:archaellin